MRIAIFPGSFDPITNAHVDIVERATALFDKIYVGIGVNSTKKGFFSPDERLAIVQSVFEPYKGIVEALQFKGLTVDFCGEVGAQFILRGMRNAGDFEFEKAIALNNMALAPTIESVFLVSSSGRSHISSTIVREIIANSGNISQLVPPAVVEAVSRKVND